MLGRLLFLIGLIALPASGALAQNDRSDAALQIWEAMDLDAFMEISQQEAVSGAEQSQDMLQVGPDPAALVRITKAIHDPERMKGLFLAALGASLAEDNQSWVPQALSFLNSALGQKVTVLEISMRRAFLDDDLKEDAESAAAAALASGDARAKQIAALIDDAGLIEPNVVGEMNAQFAYLQGFSVASDARFSMTVDEILSRVSAMESKIRDSTVNWLNSFLFAAYAPLSDAELAEHTDFLTSPEGVQLWSTLFEAFDTVLVQTSAELGRATAGLLQGETL